jgi:hypothetical protein
MIAIEKIAKIRKEWFLCKKLYLDIPEGEKFKTLVGG